MKHRSFSAWALLLALAASLAVSPLSALASAFSDEDTDLVIVTGARNLDDGVQVREVTPQAFVLPRVAFVGDMPIDDRAPVTFESSSASRSVVRPSGRAPPASR